MSAKKTAISGQRSEVSSKSQALEKLRARIEQAQADANRNAAEMAGLSLEDLDARVAKHTLGVNANGWQTPYPMDDPRALLLEYQFRNFNDHSRFKLALMARQTGKDFTGEGEAVFDCIERPKTEWMVAAPSERQAIDSLDQAKTWATAADLKIADYQEDRVGTSETLLKSAEVTFANGSRIRAVPGKPDTVRGRSVNIALTEFDFFENPAMTWRAILPSITNPLRGGEKKVRIWTTPNGKGGAMAKLWTKGDGAKMQWSRHLVTIYHAVLMGLPVDVAAIREAFDDPEGFSQEFLCEFLDGSNVLLPYDVIALAESAEATEFCEPAFWFNQGNPVFTGIDFGRTNDPTVCWSDELIGDVAWTREVLKLQNVSTPDQLEVLRMRIRRSTRVCFDYTGPGIGLGDLLVREFGQYDPIKHLFGKIELCTFTAGFKRELFPKLRRQFDAPVKTRIPVSVWIREDLHAMQQIVSNGEYNYWAPRTKEGHSDACTAKALATRARGTGRRGICSAAEVDFGGSQGAVGSRQGTVGIHRNLHLESSQL